MLGKIERKENRRLQKIKIRWLDDITDSVDLNLSKVWDNVKDRAAHGVTKSRTALSD